MPRKKKETVFPGYVRIRYPDQDALGFLTKQAIGKNRTLTEFAEACGLAPSTISRVINAKFVNPVSDGIIAAIAKNADPESGVTLQDLLAVHGLGEISLVEDGTFEPLDESRPYVKPTPPSGTGNIKNKPTIFISDFHIGYDFDKISQAIASTLQSQGEELVPLIAREIILNTLLESGYRVELTKDFNIVSMPQFRYLTPFAFRTNAVVADGLEQWAFEVHDGRRYSLYQRMSWIFGTAYLDHPSSHGIKVSVITSNADEFDEAKQKFSEVIIPDSISVILVDTSLRKVIEEFQITRQGCEPHPSVFGTI